MKKLIVILITLLILMPNFVFASSKRIRWKHPEKIKIYIPQHQRTTMMKHSLEEWTRKTNHEIIFYYVDKPKKADIEVQFVEKIPKTKNTDRAIGLTRTRYTNKYIVKSIIYIADKGPKNEILGNDTVYTVMLHEVGHAIGLAHSQDKLSIMHAIEDDKQEISQDDLNKLQELYNW